MEDLTQLFQNRQSEGTRRTRRCADELLLGAYADGALDAHARQALEAHLADCKNCRDQISFLIHASEWTAPTDLPGWLVTKARTLVSAKRPNRLFHDWRWTTATVAAVLVLAVVVVLAIRGPRSEKPTIEPNQTIAQPHTAPATGPPAAPSRNPEAVAMSSPFSSPRSDKRQVESSVPLIRNDRVQNHSPKILVPRDGAIVKRASLEVRWQTVADAVFYEVSLLTASGETVMSRQTESSSITVPAEIQLLPGARYFASVNAHLSAGKTVRSAIVIFRVSE